MITCPRCGYQAPDGSPWCPRCGYGCPYPVPYQQPPQQMPVQYQPQQIPSQPDIYDIPPQPQPEQPKKKEKQRRKKKLPKFLKTILIVLVTIIVLFIGIVIAAIVDVANDPTPTNTPSLSNDELMETAVAQAQQNFDETSTVWALSATPTYTLVPTNTPRPTNTPEPTATNTPIPLPEGATLYTVKEGENCWTIARDHGISEDELRQANGMTSCNIGIGDQIIIPAPSNAYYGGGYVQPDNSNRLGAIANNTDTSNCNIKGNPDSLIYHCKNSPNYDTMSNYRWFCSPEEAASAGYRPAKTMGGWCQQ